MKPDRISTCMWASTAALIATASIFYVVGYLTTLETFIGASMIVGIALVIEEELQ